MRRHHLVISFLILTILSLDCVLVLGVRRHHLVISFLILIILSLDCVLVL